MKEYYNTIAVVLFFSGIVMGSVFQDSMSGAVITAQATTVVEQADTIHKQREALLISTNEISSFREQIDRMQEAQEHSQNFIMKVEEFYNIDLMEARKAGDPKLEKLVVERVKKYRGMGGN